MFEQVRQIRIKPVEQLYLSSNTQTKMTNEEKIGTLQQKMADLTNDLRQLEERKSTLLTETEQMIQSEKDAWHVEKEAYRQEVYKEGFESGFLQGKEESITKYQEQLQMVNNVLQSATKDYHQTIEQSDGAIIDIAIKMAETIMKETIEQDRGRFVPLVKEAISELKDQSVVTIYIHPTQYDVVVQQKEELLQLLPAGTKLTIYVKADMNVLDCLIEHPFGQIDAGVKTQLQQLRRTLNEITLGNDS